MFRIRAYAGPLRQAVKAVGLAGEALRARDSAALSRVEILALGLLVLVPTLITAYGLLPELMVQTPSVNDDSVHFLFVQRAAEALASGESVVDHWDSQFEAGVPQFLYYQHLPALAVVALERLSFGTIDLLSAFNLIRYVLLVVFPATVFIAMRTFGFGTVAGALAAASSTLLSANFKYGFEYDSYTFDGFGLFTQLWAMHLSLLTVASAYAAIQRGRRTYLAALLFGVLVLTHILYAYIVAIAIGVIWLWGIRRSNLKSRVVRLAIIGVFALAISSYMWLPFLQYLPYLNATPYLQQEKYNSYGAQTILGWLTSGELLDHDRLPVMTFLLALGIGAALVSRARAGLVAIALFAVFLVLYFGRPTLGSLVDLLPLGRSILLHRFIGGVDLAVILLVGLGGALVWQLWRPAASPWRLAGASLTIALLLAPAAVERLRFYDFNAALKSRTANAVSSDIDSGIILAKIRTLPPGRVFAGLPATYGKELALGDVYFYNLLSFRAVEALPPPNESFSLTSDYIWDFDDADAADYDLWNVRYVVAPAARQMAPFLTPIIRTSRYALYQAPTTGYAEYVGIAARRAVATQTDLFASNLAWERGPLPSQRQYLRYDYPASPSNLDATGVGPGCPTGGQTDYERFQQGQINLVVECPAAATLILKTTYHPNWVVSVDHVVVSPFMVSPSYIGIALPAGKHIVDATYRATPIKLPLQALGLLALIALLLARNRLDFGPGWRLVSYPRRKAIVILGALVSAASFVAVARSVDLGESARLLASADLPQIIGALGIFIVGIIARVYIWRLLLPPRPDGSRVSTRQVAPVLMAGYLGNAILPARLGEVVRGYLISRREGVPVGGAFGSIALERAIDIGALACLGFVAALGVGAAGWVLQWTAVLAAAGILVIGALATVGLGAPLRLFAWIFGRGPARPLAGRVMARLGRFIEWSGGAHRRRAIANAVGLSVFAWAAAAAANLVIAQAVGVSLTPASAGLITAISVLVTAIPSAPAYVGTFELAVVAVAGTLGIPPAPALAFAALSHIIALIPTLVGGPLGLAWMGLDLRTVAAEAREDRTVGAEA